MRVVLCCCLTVFLNFGPLSVSATTPLDNADNISPPPVLIGEIGWAGSSVSTADEWIELWNLSDIPQSLAGWSLRGAGENDKVIFFPAEATIPAQSTYLIANYDPADAKSALSVVGQVVTTTLSLSNSELHIELRDLAGNIQDSAGDGKLPLAGFSSSTKVSMLRVDLSGNGEMEESWQSATSSQGFKPGMEDLGTPGVCDNCMSSIAETTIDTSTEESTASTTDAIPFEAIVEPILESKTPASPEIEINTEPMEQTIVTPSSTSSNELTDLGSVHTTSNTALPLNDATTSSAPHLSADETSSTQPVIDLLLESTSSSTLPLEAAEETILGHTQTTPTQPTTTPVVAQTDQPAPEMDSLSPNYSALRLNEIAPYPGKNQKEWVEITTINQSQPISLAGCELHDLQGKILTLTNQSIDPQTTPFVRVELTSARLNNQGDTLFLLDPNGNVLDSLTFDLTHAGESWIRFPDGSGAWGLTTEPTPGKTNKQTKTEQTKAPTPSQTTTSPTGPIANSSQTPTTKASATPKTPPVLTTPQARQNPVTTPKTPPLSMSQSVSTPVATVTRPETTSTTQKKTPSSSSVSSKSNPLLPYTFDMLSASETPASRVRLSGIVASPPGLLSRHAFILHAPDGRGLLVSVPSATKLPPFQTALQVSGTLRFDNQNVPYLSMGSKDSWTSEASTPTTTSPRVVDLTAPGMEDAWSLVQITGVVREVRTASFDLDLADASIRVSVRPVVQYRTKRLAVGDTVTVRGVIDPSDSEPELFPRTADEIVIMDHATTQPSTTTAGTSFPFQNSWMPLGAAAAIIAATEGGTRFHRKLKERRLQKKLQTLPSSDTGVLRESS